MPERIIIAAAKHSYAAIQATQERWRRSGPLTPIIVKATLIGLLLFYVQQSMFATWPAILFVGTALVCYMQPVFKTFLYGTSLFLTIALALLLTSRFTITLPVSLHAGVIGQLLFAAAFGFLFFILFGIKNLILAKRRQWYALLFISLVYGISLLFFTSIISGHPGWDMVLLTFFTYLLLREYFITQEHPKNRALTLIVLSLTLLFGQLAWAISLLPLGFSKAASVLTLLTMVTAGITERYLNGLLTARFLRLSLILVTVLVTVVFLSARWVI